MGGFNDFRDLLIGSTFAYANTTVAILDESEMWGKAHSWCANTVVAMRDEANSRHKTHSSLVLIEL